jgi:hypothetical protein
MAGDFPILQPPEAPEGQVIAVSGMPLFLLAIS